MSRPTHTTPDPHHRDHKITRHDYKIMERDGSTRDRFMDEMQRAEDEMRRLHDEFHRQHRQVGGAREKLTHSPAFTSATSTSLGPDQHRTTMDVQLRPPVEGSSLLSIAPERNSGAPPPPPPVSTMAIPARAPAWVMSRQQPDWMTYFQDNPDSPLVEQATDGRKQLRLRFDVSGYTPDEVRVKTVGHRLKVSAKHEEGGGDGGGDGRAARNYREFSKEFQLPDDVDPEQIKSSLSKDGILSVEAPLPKGEGNHVLPPRDY